MNGVGCLGKVICPPLGLPTIPLTSKTREAHLGRDVRHTALENGTGWRQPAAATTAVAVAVAVVVVVAAIGART